MGAVCSPVARRIRGGVVDRCVKGMNKSGTTTADDAATATAENAAELIDELEGWQTDDGERMTQNS